MYCWIFLITQSVQVCDCLSSFMQCQPCLQIRTLLMPASYKLSDFMLNHFILPSGKCQTHFPFSSFELLTTQSLLICQSQQFFTVVIAACFLSVCVHYLTAVFKCCDFASKINLKLCFCFSYVIQVIISDIDNIQSFFAILFTL